MGVRTLLVCATAAGCCASASASTPNTLVRATLTTRVPVHAAAGTRFVLGWRFANAQGTMDPSMGGVFTIFVRVVSPDGKAATTAAARARPQPTSGSGIDPLLHPNVPFRAVATVPRGGIGKIVIGFRNHGISGTFPITNDPLRR